MARQPIRIDVISRQKSLVMDRYLIDAALTPKQVQMAASPLADDDGIAESRKNRNSHSGQRGKSPLPTVSSVRHRRYATAEAFAPLLGRDGGKGRKRSRKDSPQHRPMNRLCHISERTGCCDGASGRSALAKSSS